ncbi:MAG: glutamine-synthetase adenylyltransferase, partial [Pseudomonadota bacterium]
MARSIADASTLAQQHAPYLRRLLETETLTLSDPGSLESQIDDILTEPDLDLTVPELMVHLRRNKSKIHLALALLDISGSLSQSQVTRILTRFADCCCERALQLALMQEGCGSGHLAIFALGKMGAFELNYSSDIDLIAFYDGDAFDGGARDAGEAASRAIREAMCILSERTADGYVFRTDLRLRPDPSSTPLAISTRRAELYYESVGQNWERMAWIKGRPAAGDLDLGTAFLKTLEPYMWRKHLDYWAIADVQAVKSMINTKLDRKDVKDPSPDLKLGPGGIREIEFFVQTQQIILGG